MKISSNIICFHDELGLTKTIDIFAEAGFEGIDFNTDLKEYYTDAHDEAFYKSVKQYANDKGIIFEQTHAPFGSSYTDEARTAQRFNDIIKGMRHSSWLGAEQVVVHPYNHLSYKDGKYDYMMESNLNFYKKLIPYAEEFQIKIAIENIVGAITETPEGLLELVNLLDNDVFTICYDVGHANLCEQDPVEMLRKLGNRIGCTHIHDNAGVRDIHYLPYYGKIDWESVMKAFAEVGYEGNLDYEAGIFVRNLPYELRKDCAKYMARVGKYLIERYDYYKAQQG